MDIRNEYNAGRFERTEEGLYFPRERLLAQGFFRVRKRGEEWEDSPNLVVTQGLTYILGAAVGAVTPVATWYIAPFVQATTPLASWTASNFNTEATEWTNYDGATRLEWERAATVTAGAVDSFSTKASFVSSANTQTVRGAALMSSNEKTGTGGVLMAASRFSSDKALDEDEILDIGYGLTLTAV